jgi:hypothetical protein
LIIFDTNAVNLLPPNGIRADIIRKLRQSGHHRVAVPWMVMEELVAHQAKLYPVRHQSVVNALEKLRDVLPWALESGLEPLDLGRFQDHWRGVYGEIFEVIDTSGEVARKALAREAMALPPAKRADDHSEGARDVAIWFSILEFLRENPDEHVCLVTDNPKDFGDGITYRYPMDEDVRGLESRLTRLRDFNEVVSQFTKEVSVQDAVTVVGELLRSLSVRGLVPQTAVEVLSSPSGFVGLGAADAEVCWRQWLTSPEVELLSVDDVTGHEIEGDVWYTAKAKWLLYGGAIDGSEAGVGNVACVWEMKVLFSANGENEVPTLLTPEEPSMPDTDDAKCREALLGLKERATAIAHLTLESLWPTASERLGNYIAASSAKLDIASLINPKFNIAAGLGSKLDLAGLTGPTKMDIASLIDTKRDFIGAKRDIATGLGPKPDIAAGLDPKGYIASYLGTKLDLPDFVGRSAAQQIAAYQVKVSDGSPVPADNDGAQASLESDDKTSSDDAGEQS